MNDVVKLLTNEDGDKYANSFWHLISPINEQGRATLCTDEFFGYGESNCKYEAKMGKITCPDCIEKIKTIKAIKL